MTDNTKYPVVNNTAASRFQLEAEGAHAILEYRLRDHAINLVHTEVPQQLRGRGLADQLVGAALEYAREHQLRVIPSCPFVKAYLRRHPDALGPARP